MRESLFHISIPYLQVSLHRSTPAFLLKNMTTIQNGESERAVAVYCGSSPGSQKAYHAAARSVGTALAVAGRPLVYGGGFKGIMGIVSGAVLEAGGRVTGVIPYAIMAAGGEGTRVESTTTAAPQISRLPGDDRKESVETIVVNSMHERKIEMAKRSCGFVGLPGGFGTFEEVFEVTTWTQIGLHCKPVILANVLSYFEPLRQLIQNGIQEGFIPPQNASLITFIDGPENPEDQELFDWGVAVIEALESWDKSQFLSLDYNWTSRADGTLAKEGLDST